MSSAGVRAVAIALGVYLLAVVLFLLSRDPDRFLNALAILGVAAAMLLVMWLMRTALAGDDHFWHRVVVIGVLGLSGIALIVAWFTSNRPDGVGFVGFASTYLAFGLTIAECRHQAWNGTVGKIALAICGVALVLGLIGLAAGVSSSELVVAAAVLLSPIGLNLWSAALNHEEADPPPPPASPKPWLLYAGLAGLVVAVVVLIALHIPAAVVLVLGGIALGLMVAITIPQSIDVVIIVAVLAAVALGSQTEVPTPTNVQRQVGAPAFAALGDSFISGEGAHEFLEGTNVKGSNECRRSPHAYVPLLADDPPPGVPGRVIFLACSGAKIDELVSRNQYPVEPTYHVKVPDRRKSVHGQLGVLEAVGTKRVKFVLLSIGGNDALFGTIAQACLLPGDCSKLGRAWLANLDQVEGRLVRVYTRLKRQLPHIPVLVMPYPVPLAEKPCGYSLFTENETRFLFGFTHALDDVVNRAATRVGFRYVDTVPDSLEKHRICDGPRSQIAVNFLRLNGVTGTFEDRINPKNWLHNNLHPNEQGHELIRDALVRWIAAHPFDRSPSTTELTGEVPSLQSLVAGQSGRTCVGTADVKACSGTWARDQTVGTMWSRLPFFLLMFAAAWLLAIWLVGFVRKLLA